GHRCAGAGDHSSALASAGFVDACRGVVVCRGRSVRAVQPAVSAAPGAVSRNHLADVAASGAVDVSRCHSHGPGGADQG
ncbi:hypothetical protein MXE27_11815, partial [Methanobacterium alcaliphilum]|nr:hypothetical protein [Methanobacterium alcaliphilum]